MTVSVDQSKALLSKELGDRSTQIGERIGALAGDMRLVGRQLREYGASPLVTSYVEHGAKLAEQFGRYLAAADGGRLIGDLEEYTRRKPWVVAGAVAAAGFAAARMLKTSRARYAR
jgi:hypothetical protein